MKFSSACILSAIAASALAAPSPSSHVLHECRAETTRHWEKRDRLKRDAVLPMRIGLQQGNLDKGHDLLMEV